MDDFLAQFQFINNYLSGGLVTAAVWLGKSLYRARQDLDFAHNKIRNLETAVGELQADMDEMSHDIEEWK